MSQMNVLIVTSMGSSGFMTSAAQGPLTLQLHVSLMIKESSKFFGVFTASCIIYGVNVVTI